jgi:hypothetical protein
VALISVAAWRLALVGPYDPPALAMRTSTPRPSNPSYRTPQVFGRTSRTVATSADDHIIGIHRHPDLQLYLDDCEPKGLRDAFPLVPDSYGQAVQAVMTV